MPDIDRLRCWECNYDLTGLPEHRCPECGTKFDPEQLRRRYESRADRARLTWPAIASRYVLLTMAACLMCGVLALAGRMTVHVWKMDHADRRFVFWIAYFPLLIFILSAILLIRSFGLALIERVRAHAAVGLSVRFARRRARAVFVIIYGATLLGVLRFLYACTMDVVWGRY